MFCLLQFAINIQFIGKRIGVERIQTVEISHIYLVAIAVELDGRIDFLHLFVFWCGLAVAHYHTVEAERLEVGLVTKVATVGNLHLRGGTRTLTVWTAPHAVAVDALVNPVPKESAEHMGVRVELIPIVLEVAQGIAHAMAVLAGHDGAGMFS